MFKLPDKTKIFLGAPWLWTWILLQFNKLCQTILHGILYWVPNNYIPIFTKCLNKSPVKLIKAMDMRGNDITNKLNLFLNLRWDDSLGGVDIKDFARYLGTTFIWVIYLLEYELSPIYNDFIKSIHSKKFNNKDFNKLFKALVIDLSKKIIYRLEKNIEEDLVFGETVF